MLRSFILLLLLLSWSGVAQAVDYTQDVNCQGAWLFNEGSGTTVADSSSNTNTGNFKSSGEPAWAAMAGTNAPSYADYQVQFDGTNDYIDCDNSTDFDIQTPTIVGWVRANASPNSSNPIMGHGSGNWVFRLTGDPKMMFLDSHVAVIATADTTITTGEWAHVSLTTEDLATDTYKFYLNGVADGNGTYSNNVASRASKKAWLGADASLNDVLDEYGNNDQSETALFDRLLSSTEINDIMDNGLVGAAAPTFTPKIIFF